MAGYSDTRQLIIDTLTGRPAGTEIQPEDHQAFALALNDYIRSVELVAGSGVPVAFAEPDTVPVQPNNGQAVYLSQVPRGTTKTFSNFIGQDGNALSISSEDYEVKIVTLLWNGSYWSSQIVSIREGICSEKITYADLVALRDNDDLVAGSFYRITDYITTTSQVNTQSAGHQFDIIVFALTNNTLSERAWACHHEGDTYFQNSHLAAWQIWYSLDNDAERFAWADSENGKGVIYRMIDEWNNDCLYDFKNIQFKHPNDPVVYPAFYYTFSTVISGVVGDHSHNGGYCYGNAIGLYGSVQNQLLNRIVFINTSKISACYSNSFGNECYSNSFGNNCYRNSFGNYCYNNSFGSYCNSNSFGNSCYRNSFGNKNNSNSFGNGCYSNSFGNYCRYNKADDGVSVVLNNRETASSNQQVQNYHLTSGLTSKTIEVERNRAYQTTVAIDSSGNVKQFCIADIMA